MNKSKIMGEIISSGLGGGGGGGGGQGFGDLTKAAEQGVGSRYLLKLIKHVVSTHPFNTV